MNKIQHYQPQSAIVPSVDPNEMVMVPVNEYLELKQSARSKQLYFQPSTVSSSSQWQPVKWFLLGSATMCGLGLLVLSIIPDPQPEIVKEPVYIPVPVETPSPAPVQPAQNQQNATCTSDCEARHNNFSIFGGN